MDKSYVADTIIISGLPGSGASGTGPGSSTVSTISDWAISEIINTLMATCLSYVSSLVLAFRAYYTIKDWKVVFLLCGGVKYTQARDINKARAILAELE